MNSKAIRISAERSATASAKIEGRETPPGYSRSDTVNKYIEQVTKQNTEN